MIKIVYRQSLFIFDDVFRVQLYFFNNFFVRRQFYQTSLKLSAGIQALELANTRVFYL